MTVDYGWWLQYDLWPLDEAVLLLCEIDPRAERASLLKKAFRRDTAPEEEGDREAYMTYRKAESGLDAGKLPYHHGSTVEPHVFLRWAERKASRYPKD